MKLVVEDVWTRLKSYKSGHLVMEALAGKPSAEAGQEDDTSIWPRRIAQNLKKKLRNQFKRIAKLPKIALYLGGFTLGYLYDLENDQIKRGRIMGQ